MKELRRYLPWIAALFLTACTDGATRIANELASAAATLQHSQATTYTLRHMPQARPEGCSGAYQLQLSAQSALLIWCKDANGKVVASYTTTYHLNYVDVPRTLSIEKAAGEPTLIDLARHDGRIDVVALR